MSQSDITNLKELITWEFDHIMNFLLAAKDQSFEVRAAFHKFEKIEEMVDELCKHYGNLATTSSPIAQSTQAISPKANKEEDIPQECDATSKTDDQIDDSTIDISP